MPLQEISLDDKRAKAKEYYSLSKKAKDQNNKKMTIAYLQEAIKYFQSISEKEYVKHEEFCSGIDSDNEMLDDDEAPYPAACSSLNNFSLFAVDSGPEIMFDRYKAWKLKLDDKYELLICYYSLMKYANENNDRYKALSYIEQAIKIFQNFQKDSHLFEIETKDIWEHGYIKTVEYSARKEQINKAIYNMLNIKYLLEINKATILFDSGQYSEVKEILSKLIPNILQRQDFQNRIGKIYFQLALACNKLDELPAAANNFKAASRHINPEHHKSLAQIFNKLGMVYIAQLNFEQAEQSFEKALRHLNQHIKVKKVIDDVSQRGFEVMSHNLKQCREAQIEKAQTMAKV